MFEWLNNKPSRPKVLVVEDDQSLQPVIFRLIQKISSSCEVTWVTKGSQALVELSKHSYDLIISDVFLNGSMSGFDLIRKQPKIARQGRFILMSGQPKHALDQCCPEGSQYVHFEKPLKMSEFGQKVKQILLRGNRSL